eukprot:TRINITY_DN2699_c0_g1_i3.p2 TRINITY_DN2699_c0_g1~~TRINITY_DN2699_c0_g1_i3.p2  ORF type:complete len:314 (+),score=33.18 TRINITY_DN2699_c0_g1_i3:111-944(+)
MATPAAGAAAHHDPRAAVGEAVRFRRLSPPRAPLPREWPPAAAPPPRPTATHALALRLVGPAGAQRAGGSEAGAASPRDASPPNRSAQSSACSPPASGGCSASAPPPPAIFPDGDGSCGWASADAPLVPSPVQRPTAPPSPLEVAQRLIASRRPPPPPYAGPAAQGRLPPPPVHAGDEPRELAPAFAAARDSRRRAAPASLAAAAAAFLPRCSAPRARPFEPSPVHRSPHAHPACERCRARRPPWWPPWQTRPSGASLPMAQSSDPCLRCHGWRRRR